MTPKTSESPSAMTKSSTPKASPSMIVTPLSLMKLAASAVTGSSWGSVGGSGCRGGQVVLDGGVPGAGLRGGLAQVVRRLRAVLVGAGPGAARALDLADALETGDDRLAVGPLLERLVEHGAGVVGLHRVDGGLLVVGLLVRGHALLVGLGGDLRGVVQRGEDPLGRLALRVQCAALGDEAGGVEGVGVVHPELVVLLDGGDRLGAGVEGEDRCRIGVADLLQVGLEVGRGAEGGHLGPGDLAAVLGEGLLEAGEELVT